MRNLLKRQEGFTLLELLIVIVIIGILALIIVPGLASGPKRARDSQRKSDMRAVKNALETYYNDNNGYPDTSSSYPTLSSHLVTAYLPSLPSDPKSGNPAYEYSTASGTCTSSLCTKFKLTATLENTKDSQITTAPNKYEVNSVN